MDNDTNGIVVVVIAQPVAGRLTAFGFDGAASVREWRNVHSLTPDFSSIAALVFENPLHEVRINLHGGERPPKLTDIAHILW